MEEKNFEEFFTRTAKFICHIEELLGKIEQDWLKTATEEELRAIQEAEEAEEASRYDDDDIDYDEFDEYYDED